MAQARTRRQTMAAAAGLLLAALLATTGARLTLAGVAAYQAQSFIDDWRIAGVEPSDTAWRAGRSAAGRAVQLYPVANGAYLDRLGQVLLWRGFASPLIPPGTPWLGKSETVRTRQEAVSVLAAAAAARPTDPGVQVRLAHAKLYLLETDAVFRQALQAADRYGRNAPEVNREMATVGLVAWPGLAAAERRIVLAHVQRTSTLGADDRRRIAQAIQDTGPDAELCRDLRQMADAPGCGE